MKVFCILSDERAFNSKSPAMHSAVLKKARIAGIYVPFRVRPDELQDAVRGVRALNIAGVNITVPYKEKIAPFLDSLSEEAKKLGAATKSGLMVGLGENREEITQSFSDLRKSSCDLLTIGQYLPPSRSHARVRKYYSPAEFEELTARSLTGWQSINTKGQQANTRFIQFQPDVPHLIVVEFMIHAFADIPAYHEIAVDAEVQQPALGGPVNGLR